MSTIETNWTKPEFKAYLLLYAANANYFESDDEKDVILNMVPVEMYKAIHKELDRDNDYQSIQKILYNIDKFSYSKEEMESLVKDIQQVFNADGQHDILEDNMLLALRKFLK